MQLASMESGALLDPINEHNLSSSKSLSSSSPLSSTIMSTNQFIFHVGEGECTSSAPFVLPSNASAWGDVSCFDKTADIGPNNLFSNAMGDSISIFSNATPHCDNYDIPSYHPSRVDLSLGTELYYIDSPHTNPWPPELPQSHLSLYSSTTSMQSLHGFQHISDNHYYSGSNPCTSYSSPNYSLHHNEIMPLMDFIANDRTYLQNDGHLSMLQCKGTHHQEQNWYNFLQHDEDINQEVEYTLDYLTTTSMMVPEHHDQFAQSGHPVQLMINHSHSVPINLTQMCQDQIDHNNKHINHSSACTNDQLKQYKKKAHEMDEAFACKLSHKRPTPDGQHEKDWPPAQCSAPPVKRSASWNSKDTLRLNLKNSTNEGLVAGICKRSTLSPNSTKPNNTKQKSPTLDQNYMRPRAPSQGVANDPQSIAARHRREKINERLRILQQLVPNGSKVDLVTMLEKAFRYVKFLQLQVKVLSVDEYWPTPLCNKLLPLISDLAESSIKESTARLDMDIISKAMLTLDQTANKA